MNEVTVTSQENLANEVRYGDGRTFVTDEPQSAGGNDQGPDPYTLLLAALGSCISMTSTLYARKKGWSLKKTTVRLRQGRVHAKDCKECDASSDAFVHRIERKVTFEGELTEEQLARLQEITHKCPIHKTLSSQIAIVELKEE